MTRPVFRVIDGGKARTGTASFACTWCGETFEDAGSLKSHWVISPACSVNKNANNATDGKYSTRAQAGEDARFLVTWFGQPETEALLGLVIADIMPNAAYLSTELGKRMARRLHQLLLDSLKQP